MEPNVTNEYWMAVDYLHQARPLQARPLHARPLTFAQSQWQNKKRKHCVKRQHHHCCHVSITIPRQHMASKCEILLTPFLYHYPSVLNISTYNYAHVLFYIFYLQNTFMHTYIHQSAKTLKLPALPNIVQVPLCSQQNTDQSIKLPVPDYLLPIEHPDA